MEKYLIITLLCSDELITALSQFHLKTKQISSFQHFLKSSLYSQLSLISVNTCMNPSSTEGKLVVSFEYFRPESPKG